MKCPSEASSRASDQRPLDSNATKSTFTLIQNFNVCVLLDEVKATEQKLCHAFHACHESITPILHDVCVGGASESES